MDLTDELYEAVGWCRDAPDTLNTEPELSVGSEGKLIGTGELVCCIVDDVGVGGVSAVRDI